MNYDEEIAKLEQLSALQGENGEPVTVSGELLNSILSLIKNISAELNDISERLKRNEEFTNSLSEDLCDIQDEIGGTDLGSDLGGVDLAQFFAQMNASEEDDDDCDCGDEHCHHHHHAHDDDDDSEGDSEYVRCPFCNTLILGDTSAKKYDCPFCGGSFTQEDMV